MFSTNTWNVYFRRFKQGTGRHVKFDEIKTDLRKLGTFVSLVTFTIEIRLSIDS